MPIIFPTKLSNTNSKNEIDIELMKKFMYDVEMLEGIKSHIIAGDEPTLHSSFEKLLLSFKDLGHTLSLVTNALDRTAIESIVKYKKQVKQVNINFEFPNKEQNEKGDEKSAFDQALNSLLYLQENQILVTPVFTIDTYDTHLVDEIFQFVEQYQTDGALILNIDNHNSQSIETQQTALEKYNSLKDNNSKIRFNSKENKSNVASKSSFSFCNIMEPTLKDAVLTSDGDIWACSNFIDIVHQQKDKNLEKTQSPVIGNVNEHLLDVILETKKRHTLKVKNMRFKDIMSGKLSDEKERMCEYCKSYHS